MKSFASEGWLEWFFLALALGLGWWSGIGASTPRRDFVLHSRPRNSLRVVTWNVGESVAANQQSAGSVLPSKHEAAAIETLKVLDADLIVLQEIAGRRQLRRIGSALGGNPLMEVGRRQERSVGIIARNALAAGGGGLFAEDEPSGLLVQLSHPTGFDVAVVGLHANPWQAKRRNAQIGRAMERLLALEAGAFFLLGDLNLDVDPNGAQELFSDSEHLDEESYAFLSESMVDAGLGSGATAEPDRRLDYIFFAGDAILLGECAPWRGRRVGKMDHHPLVADFEFSPR